MGVLKMDFIKIVLIIILSIVLGASIYSQEISKKATEEVIADLTKQIESDPKCVNCYYERAQLWLMLINENKLKEDIEQLKELENKGWMYHHVCALYELFLGNRGDFQVALEHFNLAIKLNKSNFELQIQKAQFEILNNNNEQSIKTFEELKANLEEKLDECNYNLAGVSFKDGKYKEALKYLDQIKTPNKSSIRLKGKILIEKGDFSKGMEILNSLLIQYPIDKELEILIIKYNIIGEKFKVAREQLKKMIKNDPLGEDLEIDKYMFEGYLSSHENKKLIFKLISYLIDKENYTEAKYLLKRAIKVEPNSTEIKRMLDKCK